MLKKEKLFKNKKHFKYEMAQRLNKRERKKQRIEAKRKIKAKENNRIKLKEYKKEKRAKKGERRIHSKTQERKNLVRTIRKLARILRNISSPRVHTEKNFRERIEEKEKIRYRKEIRRMQKEHVVRFAFAWALWLLVRPKTSKKDFHLSIDESKKQKENIVRVKESTYWILLAVIWYLVMIREQRMFVTQKKKQKKKTKALPKPILPFSPQRGIIFAYAT